MSLRERFLKLCARTGVPSVISSDAWAVVESRYSEPHRHYHDLRHIGSMLGEMDMARTGDIAMEFAIWFHDVVYDPKARDNEAQSAVLFESILGGHLNRNLAETVVRLILATDHSREKTGRDDEALMRDIDLTILASADDEYLAYASAIRREYAHVADEDFKAGRRAVLDHFLAKPVFETESFSHKEEAARENLEAERKKLFPGN
ncbi:hypothetical protein JIN84_16580 [Luteolibacter yonseiensis]|uniref:Metal-dependent HD superfamily phosphohydrolase n=1 Tax=Luteolibacter yonseiensis TaxID=1144680 RepID=A0A934VBG4_9BACT|nr:hypothetical protein [Luteolibacter yonseiensis]MBK1817238.1 hypothetical protein [Luteolibacter yonseiensis]